MSPLKCRVLFVIGVSSALLLVNVALTMHGDAQQVYAELCKQFPNMANMPHCTVNIMPEHYQNNWVLAQKF